MPSSSIIYSFAELGRSSKERFIVVSAKVSPPIVSGYPDVGLSCLEVIPLYGLFSLLNGLILPV